MSISKITSVLFSLSLAVLIHGEDVGKQGEITEIVAFLQRVTSSHYDVKSIKSDCLVIRKWPSERVSCLGRLSWEIIGDSREKDAEFDSRFYALFWECVVELNQRGDQSANLELDYLRARCANDGGMSLQFDSIVKRRRTERVP